MRQTRTDQKTQFTSSALCKLFTNVYELDCGVEIDEHVSLTSHLASTIGEPGLNARNLFGSLIGDFPR